MGAAVDEHGVEDQPAGGEVEEAEEQERRASLQLLGEQRESAAGEDRLLEIGLQVHQLHRMEPAQPAEHDVERGEGAGVGERNIGLGQQVRIELAVLEDLPGMPGMDVRIRGGGVEQVELLARDGEESRQPQDMAGEVDGACSTQQSGEAVAPCEVRHQKGEGDDDLRERDAG